MFCQYQYYRRDTEKLQAAVDHKTKCSKPSWWQILLRRNCQYTGTTLINKIPWKYLKVDCVWSPQEADQEGGGMMEVRYDVVRDRYFTINTEGRTGRSGGTESGAGRTSTGENLVMIGRTSSI